MALDINGYNETFKAFVDFAKIHDTTDELKKTIVRASVDAPTMIFPTRDCNLLQCCV